MLSTLRVDAKARVLFVAKTEALALFVVGWVCVRLLGSADVSLSPAMAALLERLEVVYPKKGESMPSVHRRYSCSDGRLWPSPPEVRSGSEQYDLVIVDESHHVFADSATRQEIEQRFVSSAARVLLLSDGSQSTAVDNDSESETTASAADTMTVVLTEVVRCSRRVVEAAKPFQTATTETETTCHHHSAGVPLRSHLFPAATDAQTPADRTAVYARETAAAMVATAREFPGLSWDQVRSVV